MKKTIISLITTILIIMALVISNNKVQASYNYGPLDEIASASSMTVTKVIDSSNLKDNLGNLATYKFGNICDVAVYENSVYIADSSNNKIVVLNENLDFVTTFPLDNSLNSPQGLYITKDKIYVCDYGNNRIAIYDKTYNLIQEVNTPDDLAFKDYEFRPKKITVTKSGRMYVVAEGINEGIIDFNPNGTFSRYYGTNSVTISSWKAFWLLFTSEEQRKLQGYTFGASLTNLAIDKDEYVYTVSSSASSNNFIKKLNFKGNDVLTRNGFYAPNGEQKDETENDLVPKGTSSFVDIDVSDYGTYIALDKTRGRIFGYDFEGNLLYVAGQLATVQTKMTGTLTGTFRMPEALCFFKDKILVVDSQNQNLVVLEFSEFGKLVNEATSYYYHNDYENASKKWQEVLSLNTNYFLAYAGIGKAQLREGNYKDAMTNLKLGYDTYSYSRAYEQYRYQKISNVAPYVIAVALIGLIAALVKIAISNANKEE